MNHKTNIVKKPWGYEYLAYENEHVALWFLYIDSGQSTSMHCHPNKTTGLMLVDGNVQVSFISNTNDLKPGQKLMIRKGLFHSTRTTSSKGALVFEIETPVDKNDLVRFKDNYGREGKPYEDHTFEYPKQSDCIWIKDPEIDKVNLYNISDNISVRVANITTSEQLKQLNQGTNVTFLRGGIMTEYGINVVSPGDIVAMEALNALLEVFNKVDESTIIMTMENNNE